MAAVSVVVPNLVRVRRVSEKKMKKVFVLTTTITKHTVPYTLKPVNALSALKTTLAFF
jgi:hypothetical protein